MTQLHDETILILDFGSQYTQLIARRVREQQVYCEIIPFNTSIETIIKRNPKGLILSGGPSSVYAEDAPIPDKRIFDLNIPVLGICYGLQLIGFLLDGEVDRAARREFGHARLTVDDFQDLFKDLPDEFDVWMSHGDHLTALPSGFERLGHTENAEIASIANRSRKIYGLQFHPEVVHTPLGAKILDNFIKGICQCSGQWTAEHFVESSIQKIKDQVGDGRVICGLSGGVDSAVAATLIHKAVGDRLTSVFVDNGLLRKNEAEEVQAAFKHLNLVFVDATELFLQALHQVSDPEQKRKIIGKTFIDVFDAQAKSIGEVDYLAQGTLYPDVIESVSTWGPSVTIKSHHNVGGLPERMHLKLVEPLRELFKDEVRAVGRALEIDPLILGRHPFPGPGLAVRCIGEITSQRLDLLREADAIFIEELHSSNTYNEIWQAFVVLLPVHTVGVMGDERTYENAVVLRAVTSQDGMTADWAKLSPELLSRVSNRIINEVRGINRVVYDVSSKPPGTIEWE
ncbi:glutamine-hydrolyzing GMP synthase [candidate division KSB1 bacterium]|nr:glutamine-hydrolyzing GMP synthase [candidate division KSB1 bacterium]